MNKVLIIFILGFAFDYTYNRYFFPMILPYIYTPPSKNVTESAQSNNETQGSASRAPEQKDDTNYTEEEIKEYLNDARIHISFE